MSKKKKPIKYDPELLEQFFAPIMEGSRLKLQPGQRISYSISGENQQIEIKAPFNKGYVKHSGEELDQSLPVPYVNDMSYYKKVYNRYLDRYNSSGMTELDSIKNSINREYDRNEKELGRNISRLKAVVNQELKKNDVQKHDLKKQLFDIVDDKAFCLSDSPSKRQFQQTYYIIVSLIEKLDQSSKQPSDFQIDAWQYLHFCYEAFAELKKKWLTLLAIGTINKQAIKEDFPNNLLVIHERFAINPNRELVKDFLKNEWGYDKEYYDFYLEYLSRWETRNIKDFYKKALKNEIESKFPKIEIPGSTAIRNAVERWDNSDTRTEK